ncbi:MAG TPA: RNA 2',3'-cyclic phosphodiesterase [Solirubrobacteraceae bacterium]|jgi:2'-5' RNA ligase|nr:RNA 2',3'-cyclic phosphodiesterase [Solirubrobacteraceae bacterium]
MSRRAPSARLFIAVDPPKQVAVQLTAWTRSTARDMRSHARGSQHALRVLDPELLHVTLCFLGNRPVEEIPALTDRLAECERPPVQLSVGAPLWLPPRRPRALAVELYDEGNALARIQAQATAMLEPADGETPERPRAGASAKPRRFRPHITVARMRSGVGSRRSRGPSGERGEPALPPTPALSFAPAELVLYRSWLSPEGASYEPLSAFPLR